MSSEDLFDEKASYEFLNNFDFTRNDRNYSIKFFDLGFSETLDENGFGSASTSGTPAYSSPE
jgi:hypothetical protein